MKEKIDIGKPPAIAATVLFSVLPNEALLKNKYMCGKK